MPTRSDRIVCTSTESQLEGITRQPAFLTISVDDGNVSDLTTAELLCKVGLKATFYIPRSNPERPVMGLSQIKNLATTFEVGGHTLSHVQLPKLGRSRAWNEIRGCKDWLQDLLGQRVHSFCYPRGKYSREICDLVAKAGFLGARTCRYNLNHLPVDPFRAGVSTEAFSHSVTVQCRHALFERNFNGLLGFFKIHDMATDWEIHFRRALDWVEINGGAAHLYLHSWEVEQRNEWPKLERAFRDASRRKRLAPITNGDLFSLVTATSVALQHSA
jgi:peptidoglycan/xylan/chitin deacetylase (PgdA/CDA1 family)